MSERYFYTEGSFSDDLRIVERTGMNSTQVIASVGVRTKYRKTGETVYAGPLGGEREKLESYKATDFVTSEELADVICEYLEEKYQRHISAALGGQS